MPVDFTGEPAAFVEIGDGGAHDPQMKIAAPDNSCIWNDFPVCISYPATLSCGSTRVASSSQLSSFVTAPGPGTSGPSPAQWPDAYVYDYLNGLLCGNTLQARIQFLASSAGTSVGSVGIFQQGDGVCGAKPGPILGAYDSGWFDIGCEDCNAGAPDNIAITPGFSNFSPISGSVQIDNGILDLQWIPGAPSLVYAANFPGYVVWRPPCYEPLSSMTDLPPGLWIALPSDPCGDLFETYTQLQAAINALDLGFVVTILGGHPFDVVKPDPSCPIETHLLRDWYCCPMEGAICSGTAGDTPGG